MPQLRQLSAIMFTDIVGYTALMGNKAESGKEIAVKGRYPYQDFKEKYDSYLEHTK